MAETVFREYSPPDIPELTSLWVDIFGDSGKLVSAFFRVLPDIGTCFVAECGNEIAGMASVITDLLLKERCGCRKCAYIYAVATDKRFRGAGIGGTLSRMAADYGKKHGAEIICTLPADDGLYAMYEKTTGLNNTLTRKKVTVFRGPAQEEQFPLIPVSPAEYNRKREELLSSLPHISVSDRSIEFLKTLCVENSGDIFVSENCCAALYVTGDEVFFPELLCPETEREDLMALGAAMKNVSGAFRFIPSDDGERSIAYSGNLVYHNPVWNITFE